MLGSSAATVIVVGINVPHIITVADNAKAKILLSFIIRILLNIIFVLLAITTMPYMINISNIITYSIYFAESGHLLQKMTKSPLESFTQFKWTPESAGP